MSTATIIENLNTLAAAIAAYPEELFNLQRYRLQQDCGTLYCSAGLAASMPFFQKQGMTYDEDGHGDVLVGGVFIAQSFNRLNEMFGPNAFDVLFSCFAGGLCDTELFKNIDDRKTTDQTISHKELALERIAKQIKIVSQDARK
jgi:hypothetical protein